MSLFNHQSPDENPALGCLIAFTGFFVDSIRFLFDWNKPDDESMAQFLLNKFSALMLMFLALAGMLGFCFVIYAQFRSKIH